MINIRKLRKLRFVNKYFNYIYIINRNIYNFDFLNDLKFIYKNDDFINKFMYYIELILYDKDLLDETKNIAKNLLIIYNQKKCRIIFRKNKFYNLLYSNKLNINIFTDIFFSFTNFDNTFLEYMLYPNIYIGSISRFLENNEININDINMLNVNINNIILIYRNFNETFGQLIKNNKFKIVNNYDTYIDIILNLFNNNKYFAIDPLRKYVYRKKDLTKNYYIVS